VLNDFCNRHIGRCSVTRKLLALLSHGQFLSSFAYDLTEEHEATGPAAAIRLAADRAEINADGEDVSILKVEVLDKEGRTVPTANNKIRFKVSGDGELIGVGNGAPNCQESDKEPRRSLFNGLAQVILQSTKHPGEIRVEASREGSDGPKLVAAKLVITTEQTEVRPAVPVVLES
jgi:beta-galactosidase